MKAFMLAGTSSSVGKTTMTMGILSALRQRGEKVVPFKTGPDYIDPMFHEFVTGHPSSNLDTWMIDSEMIRTLFYEKLSEDSTAVVEGVMGLFDGHGSGGEVGSSAYLAKILDIPVFLIINGRGMSTSAAAMVKGYAEFDPALNVAGVIVNGLSSESHFRLLKNAIESRTGVPCVGWLPKDSALAVGSRHLGLIPADELENLKQTVEKAGHLAAEHIDIDRMLSLAEKSMPEGLADDPFDKRQGEYADLTVGYAFDKAFNFYYNDNLEALKKLGVNLVPFSPLEDQRLPENIDGLYLGGGFPEVFGDIFEENASMRKSIRNALEDGLPCFAECGGLMVLTNSLQTKTGERYRGVGFFDADTIMTERLQRFGYVDVDAEVDGKKFHFRAHEFHHSLVEEAAPLVKCYHVQKGKRSWQCGYTKKNTIAGYPHVHFYAAQEWLFFLLDKMRKIKKEKH